MLSDFVTMACLLLYYDEVLHSWPNSPVIEVFTLKAIDIILKTNIKTRHILQNTVSISLHTLFTVLTYNHLGASGVDPAFEKMGLNAGSMEL